MNEQQASALVSEFTARWPGRIQVSVDTSAVRGTDGFALHLLLPSYNRHLRLVRMREVDGALDVCSALLGEGARLPAPDAFRQKRTNIAIVQTGEQLMEKMQQIPSASENTSIKQEELLSEDEAAAYLGIKLISVRQYVANGMFRTQQLEDGRVGIVQAGLESYRQRRDERRRHEKGKGEEESPLVQDQISGNPSSVGEAHILQALIAYAFAEIPDIRSLGQLSEAPRTWKLNVTTARGPESYRATRGIDGSFSLERWS